LSKNLLKKLIYITVLILTIILFYKIYLYFDESDFKGSNYQNIKIIESTEQRDMYSFAVFGSAENSIDIFERKIIVGINEDNNIAFAISTGNAVLDGAEGKYRQLYKSLKGLKVPALFGLGDTEISDKGDRRFYEHFGPFYFSFAYGDSYFIFIDTTGTTSLEMQKEWISSELIKADSYDHKFVFMNDTPLKSSEKSTVSSENNIEDENIREYLFNEFSTHKVTSVFTNGSVYKVRIVDGVPYYSSGGAGGLYLGKNSNYHYIKVNVSADGVVVKPVVQPLISNNIIIQRMENIWIYIHSMFYAQFLNIFFSIFLILLLFLTLYRKAKKDVDYYRDFSGTNKSVDKEKKLKIAMLTNNYFPFVGGVPISINRLSGALRERGHKVVIFAPHYPESESSEEDVFRCKLLYYKKAGNFNFAIANIFSSQIDKEFIKNDFDIIHVHHPFWMGKKGLSLGKKNDIPVVLTYHTRFEMYSENLPFLKLVFKNIISHKIVKRFAQKCDAVIAPTVSAKEYLSNIGVSRNKLVLPTGIDCGRYKVVDESTVQNIRNSYVSNGELLLCCVSRLSPEKNLDFLINGLRDVKENTSEKFKCIIIGTGPERENIQNSIDRYSLNNEVLLIGTVKPDDMPLYYNASDLFVFSSLSETQGMVILEAMAGKCPVVCIRSSGTDDMIKDGFNGYKTSQAITEWSGKIIDLLENRDVLDMMSTNAFLFSQKFSLEKMAERVETFYKKTIAGKADQPKEIK